METRLFHKIFFTLTCFLLLNGAAVTQPARAVHTNYQGWTSINTVAGLDRHWALIGDFHIRRNDFFREPGFYFVRTGLGYYFKRNFYVVAGYGHMWLSSPVQQHYVFAGENRIYQQVQYSLRWHKTAITQRIRNEQRWQQKIIDGKQTGYNRFSNRVRYLLSFSVPVFKNEKMPVLVIADEAAVHFGREIIYNRFDQNRLFIGFKQKLSRSLSADFGYMNQYQEKYVQYQRDNNHVFRLFFYYTPSL